MTNENNSQGLIAVDKMGAKILFLNPKTYATEIVLDGFKRTVHELPDRAGARRPAGHGLRADLRRRHPRPQSQSAA